MNKWDRTMLDMFSDTEGPKHMFLMTPHIYSADSYTDSILVCGKSLLL